MALVPFATRLARFQALPPTKKVPEHIRRRRARKAAARKQRRALLTNVRAVLGWKPGGMTGRKLTAEHLKALAEGRERYLRAKRGADCKA
jgi:hypothetical protein